MTLPGGWGVCDRSGELVQVALEVRVCRPGLRESGKNDKVFENQKARGARPTETWEAPCCRTRGDPSAPALPQNPPSCVSALSVPQAPSVFTQGPRDEAQPSSQRTWVLDARTGRWQETLALASSREDAPAMS